MEISLYNIDLNLDPSEETFSGITVIEYSGLEGDLNLNSVDLNILKVTQNGKEVTYRQVSEEVIGISSLEEDGEVLIEYNAPYSNALIGLYKSEYGSGTMLSTQCESTGARRIFPCIDHPSFKSIFKLKVSTQKNLEVITNTPAVRIEESGNEKIWEFSSTPKMSTYLFYLGVGEFETVSTSVGNVKLSVKVTKNNIGKDLQTPLDFGRIFLEYLQEYFDIPYPLEKIDLIGVPEFSAGAMENWGAITFRELYLLVSKSTSVTIKRRIAEVIAHELVHQWFGNLVTMKWWNDLWLNESFATFVAYKAVDKLFPEWQHWNDFLLSETYSALDSDSLEETHPIETKVENTADIEEMFDNISYGKGGSILRMIEEYIGEDSFREGVRYYLKKNAYSNAEGESLWKCMEKASGKEVGKIMEAWIRESGFPYIKATYDEKLHLEQSMFKYNKVKLSNNTWPIPITLFTGDEKREFLLENTKTSFDIECEPFVKINSGATGFYMCMYDESLTKKLLANSFSLPAYDAFGYISDMFAFLRADMVTLQEFISACEAFSDRNEYIIVDFITSCITYLLRITNNRIVIGFARDYLNSHMTSIGIKKENDEDEDISSLRGELAAALVKIDSVFAKKLLDAYGGYFDTDPEMRSAFALADINESANGIQSIYESYMAADNDEDKAKLSNAMFLSNKKEACLKGIAMLNKDIKKQDRVKTLANAFQNLKFNSILWEWLKGNIDEMIIDFEGTSYVSKMLESIIQYVGLGIEGYDAFFDDPKFDRQISGIKKGKERLLINKRIFDKYNV